MIKLATPLIRTMAMAAFVSSLSFGLPAFAQSSDASDTTPSAVDQGSSDQGSAMASKSMSMSKDKHGAMSVEQRIKTLHDKLMITAAQEDEWSKVAQTMRDNESTIEPLIQARHENSANMTALDDIKSYQQITQAHADGMQKLLAAFEPLYNDLSDDQKKNADSIFGHYEGHDGMHKNSKKHSS